MDAPAVTCLLVLLVLGIATPLPAAERCNEQEFPPIAGAQGYQIRQQGSERCEGLYRSKIASDFEVISFVQTSPPLTTSTLYITAPNALPNSPINIVAQSLRPSLYYRMDGQFNTRSPFQWPLSEVAEPLQLSPQALGIVTWQLYRDRIVLVPAALQAQANAATPTDSNKAPWGALVLRAPVDVEAVYLYKQGQADGHEQLLEQTFSARQPIPIDIPRWAPQFPDSGLLLVEVELKPAADDDWISKTLTFKVSTP